jgi:hypothetical protein
LNRYGSGNKFLSLGLKKLSKLFMSMPLNIK